MAQARNSLTQHHPRRIAAGGFTLVEVLVTIGIIVLLIGLALVAMTVGRNKAEQARMASDLQTIAVALDAYKADFGDYPRVPLGQRIGNPANLGDSTKLSGGELLCWALVGPYPQVNPGNPNPFDNLVDGADGPGFRINATGRGQVYPSYLNVERFRIGYDARSPVQRYKVILDSQNGSILYFPMTPAPPAEGHRVQDLGTGVWYPTSVSQWDPTQPVTDVRRRPMYDFFDNEVAFWRMTDVSSATPLARMRVMLGDRNDNGRIDTGGETPPQSLPFLLWSAGPDALYGPTNPNDASEVNNCDDVTNIKY